MFLLFRDLGGFGNGSRRAPTIHFSFLFLFLFFPSDELLHGSQGDAGPFVSGMSEFSREMQAAELNPKKPNGLGRVDNVKVSFRDGPGPLGMITPSRIDSHPGPL